MNKISTIYIELLLQKHCTDFRTKYKGSFLNTNKSSTEKSVFNRLAPELFFLILAHPVYKM